MKAVVFLNRPPQSGAAEWRALLAVLRDRSAARQATVIINPANGPGPREWPGRDAWLALCADIQATGARLAWYLPLMHHSSVRRSVAEIRDAIHIFRTRYQEPLSYDDAAWWLDHHPAHPDAFARLEIREAYGSLRDDFTFACPRAAPAPGFMGQCPASAVCFHFGNGWPTMRRAKICGLPVAVVACGILAVPSWASGCATYLYASPDHEPGAFNRLSPHLPRILQLK